MSNILATDSQYKTFIETLKQQIKSTSQRVVRSVNSELINLYLEIGRQIVQKQATAKWGDNLLQQIEQDLRLEFPNLKGFSRRNLFYMRGFYNFCQDFEIVPQVVAQLPWGHIRLLIDKIKDKNAAHFYIKKTVEENWSRTILDWQIDFDLFTRQGNSLNNFEQTEASDNQISLIKESFKESYVIDFLELGDVDRERQLETSIVENISKFMLELGKGFAYVGRQYKLNVGEQEFYPDLLFYNFILKRFIIIELKITDFKPEYLGQLNFYMTAINKQLKNPEDEKTIGLLICKGIDKTVVEYALSGYNEPTAVASMKLPKELQNQFPNEEQLINEISKLIDSNGTTKEDDNFEKQQAYLISQMDKDENIPTFDTNKIKPFIIKKANHLETND